MRPLTEAVVAAADGLARARVARKANDADGAAGETEEDVEVAEVDAQEA